MTTPTIRRRTLLGAGLAGLAVSALPLSAQAASRPYFAGADWLWLPPAGAALHASSTAFVSHLAAGNHALLLKDYGATVVLPGVTTATTPTYDIAFDEESSWGDPFDSKMPVPNGLVAPPLTTTYGDPGDAHVCVADTASNKVYSIWQAKPGLNPRAGTYGGVAYLNKDGTEYSGSSTASKISVLATVTRFDELKAAVAAGTDLGHTMVFSSNYCSSSFQYPAKKSDGAVVGGVPQGARVMLDPAASLSGITGAELVIAKTLQKYGAILGDFGGSSMGFVLEYNKDWTSLGLTDYQNLTKIPWAKLRVLRNWSGT